MYAVRPIPAYILIDEKGVIIGRNSAADTEEKSLHDLEEKLKNIMPIL